jgi:flagellar export protein FliJ
MAAAFRFRLEVVRELRKRARDAQQRVVARAGSETARAHQRVEQLADQISDTKQHEVLARSAPRMDIRAVSSLAIHRAWLGRQSELATAEHRERLRILDAEREKLAEAGRRLKAIEKLRERRWNAYVRALKKAEQAQLDETAIQRYLRAAASFGSPAEGRS